MPVTKECRCCTMPLVFPDGMAVQACPACRALNERPRTEGIMLENFRRAICQQADRDFYNAEKSYQYVLNSCPDNAEALWGRLLCHYGAVCVTDKDKRLWEIHMTGSTPLQEQGDFRRACQLAAPDVSAQYAGDAAYIDSAMARIRELAEKCPPYDVFLCHKTTAESGGYTEDYNRAYALYNLLTKEGYRVFFAPVEMEGVTAGEDYEAAIYHALDTARVMLVISSSPQHLTSLWVQSEWKRYLERIDGGQDKHLIPLLYGGLTAENLPQEFCYRHLQALTMELGATEKVLSAVRQYVKPKGKPWRAALAMGVVLVMLAGAGAAYLAGRGTLPAMSGALPTESTMEPTVTPTTEPTMEPTATPTAEPTATPTMEPPATPTATPTAVPTVRPTAAPTPAPQIRKVCRVTAESARARAGAGTEFEVVGYVFRGERYDVLAEAAASNGRVWYQVLVDGTVCWISSGVAEVN